MEDNEGLGRPGRSCPQEKTTDKLRRGEDGEHLRVIAEMTTTCPENGIVSPRLRKLQGKIERMEAKIQHLEERVMEAERKIKLMATSKEEVKR
jgi:hypothetical protein